MDIYTDGACKGNPGKGGWGFFVRNTNQKYYAGEENTTNNRMELFAVIKAMQFLKNENVNGNSHIYTDSQYVYLGITKWLSTWKKKNWKNSRNTLVRNDDLWKLLDKLMEQTNVDFHWIRAHNGDYGNEIADELANKGIYDKLDYFSYSL